MKGFVSCLLFYAVVCLADSTPTEYNLNSYCGSNIYVYNAAILKLDSYSINQPCVVTVYSNFHFSSSYDKVRLEIQSLHMPCGQGNYLQLYDGSRSSNPISDQICSSNWNYQTMFLTANYNYMTIVIQPSSYYSDISMSLLATGTSNSYQSGDFICTSGYYVASSLTCDGYNNCGDWSDEESYLCDVFTSSIKIVVIVGSLSFFAIVIAIIIVVTLVRRRLQSVQYRGLVNPGQYSYGAIPGGVAMPAGTNHVVAGPGYMQAPPSYQWTGGAAAGYPAYGTVPPSFAPPAYQAPPQGASSAAAVRDDKSAAAVVSPAGAAP